MLLVLICFSEIMSLRHWDQVTYCDSRTDMAARVPDPMVQNGTLLVDPWAAIS